MARTWPPPARPQADWFSSHDGSPAMQSDDQTIRSKFLDGMAYHARADAMQSTQPGDRGQFVAGSQGSGLMASASISLTCCQLGSRPG